MIVMKKYVSILLAVLLICAAFSGCSSSKKEKYSDEKLSDLMKSDVHSVARLRVNGVVMNTDLWYELYGVNRNNVLYLDEDERTYIW